MFEAPLLRKICFMEIESMGPVLGFAGLIIGFGANVIFTAFRAGQIEQKVEHTQRSLGELSRRFVLLEDDAKQNIQREARSWARMEIIVEKLESSIENLQVTLREGVPVKLASYDRDIALIKQDIALIQQQCEHRHGCV